MNVFVSVCECGCECFAPVMRTQCADALECPRVPNLSTNGEYRVGTERRKIRKIEDIVLF